MKTPIDKLMDVCYVARWSMVGTHMQQSVAEHSFNVAMLAMEIRKRMYNTSHYSEQEVCYFALIHDIREAYTGDIPTPTKIRMKAAGFDPDDVADAPDELPCPPHIASIIKAADLIECHIFISAHGAGGRGRAVAAEVEERLGDALAGASPDLARAARETLEYVLQRKSDDPVERNRIKEDSEKPSRIAAIFKFANSVD